VIAPTLAHRCDANATGVSVTAWGFDQLPCQVRTGLRSFTDRGGITRFYCGSLGHEADARRRFGRYVSEIEDDGLGQAKARDDLLDGVAHFDWRGHDIEVEVS
jgi:hypothetical protein